MGYFIWCKIVAFLHLDYEKYVSVGEKVCIIAKNSDNINVSADLIYDAGTDDTEYAARLFFLLRKADEEGADIVFAQLPGENGIGIALRNRLFKSAAGRVIMNE